MEACRQESQIKWDWHSLPWKNRSPIYVLDACGTEIVCHTGRYDAQRDETNRFLFLVSSRNVIRLGCVAG